MGSVLVSCAFVVAWQLVSAYEVVSPLFLPGPLQCIDALVGGLRSGELSQALAISIERMLYGWLLASVIGVTLGALVGSSGFARKYFQPTIEFIRPLPAASIAPVALAIFGLSNSMVLSLIAFGTTWPMLLATVHGFSTVNPRLVEVGKALKMSRWSVIWKIALPNSLPDIVAAMRLALSMAIVLSVVGEMVSGQNGVGWQILVAARNFKSADLYAGVMLLSALGLTGNLALVYAESRLLRWRND